MKVTLSKALKLKNRFGSKVQDVSEKIASYNSVTEGHECPVNVTVLMSRRGKLVEALVSLKLAINNANIPVQGSIYLLTELKSDMQFIKRLDTSHGQENTGWGENVSTVEKVATIGYADAQTLMESIEADIDLNQDILDKHNHTVGIEIADEVMALLKG